VTAADRATLERAGVPRIVVDLGMVGAATISLRLDSTYDPDEHGARVFVTPCRVDDPWSPESAEFELAAQYGMIVDVIAWHPRAPMRWATRLGLAQWLGAIEPQFCDPPPVPIRRSPVSWLRGGARGLCILDRDRRAQYRLLSLCRSLIAEDREHRAELQRVLAHPFSLPTIAVASVPRRAEVAHG
jgi:hypothetical protein